jgi:hypothetical protein
MNVFHKRLAVIWYFLLLKIFLEQFKTDIFQLIEPKAKQIKKTMISLKKSYFVFVKSEHDGKFVSNMIELKLESDIKWVNFLLAIGAD